MAGILLVPLGRSRFKRRLTNVTSSDKASAMDDVAAENQDQALIDALGGATALARRIGGNARAVANWRRRAIPAHAWPLVARAAREAGVAFDEERMLEAARLALKKRRESVQYGRRRVSEVA